MMVAPGQLCLSPGCPFGSIPVPPPHAAPPRAIPTSGGAAPSWGASREGTPLRELPMPRPGSPRWPSGPFPAEQEPTSGLHIWRPAVAPPCPGPQHLGLRAPLGQPPAPCRNPRGAGAGEGAARAPDGATLKAAGPGPWGGWLGTGGAAWGGEGGVCLGGEFPSSDRWSRIRAVAPRGLRLG